MSLFDETESKQANLSIAIDLAKIINGACDTSKDIKEILEATEQVLKIRFQELHISVEEVHT